jgi:hypothetical protein
MAPFSSLAGSFPLRPSDPLSDGTMRQSAPLTGQFCPFNGAKLTRFLTERFPRSTAKAVAHELGESPETVRNWLRGRSLPAAGAAFRMLALWGPEFLCAVMPRPPRWASDAAAREKLAQLAAQRDELNRILDAPRGG